MGARYDRCDRYREASELAERVDPAWSNWYRAVFHCFNPKGIVAAKRASDDRVRAVVEAGRAKSGALIAYGSLNDYSVKSLYRLVESNRVSSIKLAVAVDGVRADIARADKFLAELDAEVKS